MRLPRALTAAFAALCLSLFVSQAVEPNGASGVGLYGEYFATPDFTGGAKMRRTDRMVNFDWAAASPYATLPVNNFSVRWTGELQAPASADYTFAVSADDGVRLWVNGRKIIDDFTAQGARIERATPVKLNAGQRYSIRLEYFDADGAAAIKLLWAFPGRAEQLIPQQSLFPPERVEYLSNLPTKRKTNGWGPVEFDMSNGEQPARDGRMISMGGLKFAKGLGVHSASEVLYELDRKYDDFRVTLGVDDEVGAGRGSVVFEIWVDDMLEYTSPVMRGGAAPIYARVDVTGRSLLRLAVQHAGDGFSHDHADWGDAHLIVQSGGPKPAPGQDMDPWLSELAWKSAINGMGPVERNMSNGGPLAMDGRPLSIAGKKFSYGLGVHSRSEIVYDLDKEFQRFVADVGVDDEAPAGSASVVFQILADGVKVFESVRMVSGMSARRVDLNVAGVGQLKLAVHDAGDGTVNDKADWASARLYRQATDTPPPPPTPVPGAPVNLVALPGDAKVILEWGPATGAVTYNVYRGSTSGGQSGTPVAMGVTGTRYVDASVVNGTTYYYLVSGLNAGGIGPRSNEAKAMPAAPVAPPAAPSNLSAASGDRQVTLSWSASSGAVTYNVYRGATSGGQSSTPIASGLAAPSYLDTNLTNGTAYFYKVAAVNTGGISPRSNETSATPQAPITPPNPIPSSDVALWRLLRQTSWGPTEAEFNRLKQMGATAWLDDQFNAPASTYPDTLLTQNLEYTQEHFYRLTLTGSDQLRQRVAFALSQIWVVSGVEVDCAEAFVPYYRILNNRAFGNFFDIVREVTLTPAMGEYLDMVNNKKATNGILPNENFPRELLQLFMIGLAELNPDGTARLNAMGQQIPTFTQDDILELARVFTGWTYPDGVAGQPTRQNPPRYDGPMEAVESLHDNGAKRFLGTDIPPGLTATQDLDNALQIIFRHPNVGPFISRQLILRLVTSNPSPAYVGAVAAVFNNNGAGVRGDLRAVVRAILLHPEAQLAATTDGKLSEPALFITRQLRAIGATVADTPFMSDLSAEMGQRVFYSPSVFNYFSPSYRIPGTALTGPEFQLFNTATSMIRINFASRLLSGNFGTNVNLNLDSWTLLAADPGALLNRIDAVAFGGTLSPQARQAILDAVNRSPNNREKALTALYLAFTSPQYQIER